MVELTASLRLAYDAGVFHCAPRAILVDLAGDLWAFHSAHADDATARKYRLGGVASALVALALVLLKGNATLNVVGAILLVAAAFVGELVVTAERELRSLAQMSAVLEQCRAVLAERNKPPEVVVR